MLEKRKSECFPKCSVLVALVYMRDEVCHEYIEVLLSFIAVNMLMWYVADCGVWAIVNISQTVKLIYCL